MANKECMWLINFCLALPGYCLTNHIFLICHLCKINELPVPGNWMSGIVHSNFQAPINIFAYQRLNRQSKDSCASMWFRVLSAVAWTRNLGIEHLLNPVHRTAPAHRKRHMREKNHACLLKCRKEIEPYERDDECYYTCSYGRYRVLRVCDYHPVTRIRACGPFCLNHIHVLMTMP